jgi:hypothetical protein
MRNLSACNGGQLQTVSERMMVFEILRVANVALFVPAGKATFATLYAQNLKKIKKW